MWGCQEGRNPKIQCLCSKNEVAQAPTPPQNDEFCIMCHLMVLAILDIISLLLIFVSEVTNLDKTEVPVIQLSDGDQNMQVLQEILSGNYLYVL